MRFLVILASGVGAFLGKMLGCEKIFWSMASQREQDFGQAIRWMNLWCDRGSKYLLGVGFLVGLALGSAVAEKGHPRIAVLLSLIFGFIGAVITAFLYAALAS